jgi:Phytanoyl-CoA dioxygenase (PhyH)
MDNSVPLVGGKQPYAQAIPCAKREMCSRTEPCRVPRSPAICRLLFRGGVLVLALLCDLVDSSPWSSWSIPSSALYSQCEFRDGRSNHRLIRGFRSPRSFLRLRGGGSEGSGDELPLGRSGSSTAPRYKLSEDQKRAFFEDGCVTLPNVLTEEEMISIESVFDEFMPKGDSETALQAPNIHHVPGKDYCDISKPFGTPISDWSMVNCMLPTTYYPEWRDNVFELVTRDIVNQLFSSEYLSKPAESGLGKEQVTTRRMVKDYDQLLNKYPNKSDAVFAMHQDMAYWPGAVALGVNHTDTCTFSLAVDDSDEVNGCLYYIAGSGRSKSLRRHRPAMGDNREDGHALTMDLSPADQENMRHAPAKRGWVTVHDEYVIHGSGGNNDPSRQRRTYVVAYREEGIVKAERAIGFTHSHNDVVNWDTFLDGESHRVAATTAESYDPEH